MSDRINDDPTSPDSTTETTSDMTPPTDDGLKPVVTGHIPASATLYGPHPDAAPEDATGSPGADREREQAEKR